MTNKEPKVRCDAHGVRSMGVLCRHLMAGTGLRYCSVGRRQSFCQDCLDVVDQEGGWTDRAHGFARISVVCRGCYQHILGRHTCVPITDRVGP